MSEWEDFPALAEAEALIDLLEPEPEHVRHVAAMADRLFLDLVSWHGYRERERRWLWLASLLHDIGWSQTPTGQGHHKESARLILEHPWRNLSPAEVAVVAQVARYHRKKLPAADHAAYMVLPQEDRAVVDRLAGLLRVADALDRTHTQRVAGVSARIDPQEITLTVTPRDARGWEDERRMAEKKKDLLERAAARPVLLDEAV